MNSNAPLGDQTYDPVDAFSGLQPSTTCRLRATNNDTAVSGTSDSFTLYPDTVVPVIVSSSGAATLTVSLTYQSDATPASVTDGSGTGTTADADTDGGRETSTACEGPSSSPA